jgi:hypothetical protein
VTSTTDRLIKEVTSSTEAHVDRNMDHLHVYLNRSDGGDSGAAIKVALVMLGVGVGACIHALISHTWGHAAQDHTAAAAVARATAAESALTKERALRGQERKGRTAAETNRRKQHIQKYVLSWIQSWSFLSNTLSHTLSLTHTPSTPLPVEASRQGSLTRLSVM